jgi:hypothetical protein
MAVGDRQAIDVAGAVINAKMHGKTTGGGS